MEKTVDNAKQKGLVDVFRLYERFAEKIKGNPEVIKNIVDSLFPGTGSETKAPMDLKAYENNFKLMRDAISGFENELCMFILYREEKPVEQAYEAATSAINALHHTVPRVNPADSIILSRVGMTYNGFNVLDAEFVSESIWSNKVEWHDADREQRNEIFVFFLNKMHTECQYMHIFVDAMYSAYREAVMVEKHKVFGSATRKE